MSNRKNLANAILALGVSTSDTTWVLEAGYGDEMPAVPFELTATPFGQLSTMGNSEIVRVTARSTDTLTVVRAQKGTTAKAFIAGAVVSNGISTDDVVGIGVNITTARTTAAKVGTTADGNYVPVYGDKINATFTLGVAVNTPTLNIDGSGAVNIRLGNTNVSTGSLNTAASSVTIPMWFDGTYWQLYGSYVADTDTTYTEITTAEIEAGTATTTRAISGRRAEDIKRRGGQVGDISMSLRTTPGLNRLFMDGGVYNKADYPLLWALNASHPAYFTASDTLTFTLADMRERMPFGKSQNSPFTTLGNSGGAKTHTLTQAQIPNFTGNIGLHSGERGSQYVNGGGVFRSSIQDIRASYIPPPATSGGSQSFYGSINFDLGGGGQSHPIMNPYIVVNYEVIAG